MTGRISPDEPTVDYDLGAFGHRRGDAACIEREARAASVQRLPQEAASSVPPLDVERLANVLDGLDVHWFDDAAHGATGWNMAKAIAAAYTGETPEQDR